MSIQLPAFNPAAPHSMVEIGVYVEDSSTLDQMTTLKVQSNLKPNGISNYVVRVDRSKNSSVPGAPDDTLSVYTVIRGPLHSFTTEEKTALIDRVRAVLTPANIVRIERGER